jgi:hypothetical protein
MWRCSRASLSLMLTMQLCVGVYTLVDAVRGFERQHEDCTRP